MVTTRRPKAPAARTSSQLLAMTPASLYGASSAKADDTGIARAARPLCLAGTSQKFLFPQTGEENVCPPEVGPPRIYVQVTRCLSDRGRQHKSLFEGAANHRGFSYRSRTILQRFCC